MSREFVQDGFEEEVWGSLVCGGDARRPWREGGQVGVPVGHVGRGEGRLGGQRAEQPGLGGVWGLRGEGGVEGIGKCACGNEPSVGVERGASNFGVVMILHEVEQSRRQSWVGDVTRLSQGVSHDIRIRIAKCIECVGQRIGLCIKCACGEEHGHGQRA